MEKGGRTDRIVPGVAAAGPRLGGLHLEPYKHRFNREQHDQQQRTPTNTKQRIDLDSELVVPWGRIAKGAGAGACAAAVCSCAGVRCVMRVERVGSRIGAAFKGGGARAVIVCAGSEIFSATSPIRALGSHWLRGAPLANCLPLRNVCPPASSVSMTDRSDDAGPTCR